MAETNDEGRPGVAGLAALEWSLIGLAVVGTLCVSVLREVYAGHLFWLVSNVGLTTSNLAQRRWKYVVLFGVYLGTTIYGVWNWR